jgi:hypothetical protein
MSTSRLATLALFTTSLALADTDPALQGKSADSVFDAAVDLHYKAMLDEEVCAKGCTQTVVASKSIGDTSVELRKATSTYGDIYTVVLGKGDTWWAADPIDGIDQDDCGMGKCISNDISKVAIAERDGTAWVTLSIHTTIDHHVDPHHYTETHDYQIAIGCKLAGGTCTQVDAGSERESGRIKSYPKL